MLQDRRKCKNVFLRSYELASCQEKSTQRDEDITAPASCPASSEVRETCRQRRRRLGWVEGRGQDFTMQLDRYEGKILCKGVSFRYELRHLLDCSAARGFVRFRDDDGEEFRTHVCRNRLLDTLEAFFEPLRGCCEFWEDIGLSGVLFSFKTAAGICDAYFSSLE